MPQSTTGGQQLTIFGAPGRQCRRVEIASEVSRSPLLSWAQDPLTLSGSQEWLSRAKRAARHPRLSRTLPPQALQDEGVKLSSVLPKGHPLPFPRHCQEHVQQSLKPRQGKRKPRVLWHLLDVGAFQQAQELCPALAGRWTERGHRQSFLLSSFPATGGGPLHATTATPGYVPSCWPGPPQVAFLPTVGQACSLTSLDKRGQAWQGESLPPSGRR